MQFIWSAIILWTYKELESLCSLSKSQDQYSSRFMIVCIEHIQQ